MTGLEFKERMRAARVDATELAAEAGLSREWVTRLLNRPEELSGAMTGKLLQALATCAKRVVTAARAAV